MEKRYEYNKFRITISILGLLMLFIMGWVLVWKLEVFKRGLLIKDFIALFGMFFLGMIVLQIITFIILLFRMTSAVIITDEYLIDNTKYHSFGKIPWDKITSVSVIKHNNGKESIELFLSIEFSEELKLDILKKILLWFDNYGDKSKIVLRSTFLNINMEELKKNIISTFKKNNDLVM